MSQMLAMRLPSFSIGFPTAKPHNKELTHQAEEGPLIARRATLFCQRVFVMHVPFVLGIAS